MYGWRARIGLILPVDNAVMEPELMSMAPEGVAYYGVRLLTDDRKVMPEMGVEFSKAFSHIAIDVVGYACAVTSYMQGAEYERSICKRISDNLSVPVFTASSAMVDATKSMGFKKVAIATPYTDERTKLLKDFLGANGIDVVSSANESMDLFTCNLQEPRTAYRIARKADSRDAEAVIISATNLRTKEIISMLERDLGKPVITSNQAMLWAALRNVGILDSMPQFGQLLADPRYMPGK